MLYKKILLIAFTLVILSHLAIAYNPNVHLALTDITNQNQVDYVIANLNINDEIFTNNYVERDDTLNMFLPDGTYNIIFRIEDLNTPGRDYYAENTLIVDTQLTKEILLYPAATVNGIVEDEEGTLIKGAELKFECSDEFDKFPSKTDEFGFFTVKYVPVGKCKILAKYNKKVGSTDIILEKGSINETRVKIKTNITSKPNLDLIIIITLLIIIVLITKFYKSKKLKKEKLPKEEKNVIKESKRINDILITLNDKERIIVNFLLQDKNQANQANIRHSLNIPRTTLSRLLQSLESKKVIRTEKQGKAVKVYLTKWFLSKE